MLAKRHINGIDMTANLWGIELCAQIAEFGMSFSVVLKERILILRVLFSIDLQQLWFQR